MRWAGLIFSAVILATTVWFAFAAPHQGGNQLVVAVAAVIASDAA